MRPMRLTALVAAWLLIGPSTASPRIEFESNPLATPNPVPTDGAPFAPNSPGEIAVIRAELDAGDTDFYSFELDNGQLLLAAVFATGDGEFDDTLLGVFVDASPTPETTNDDGGPGRLSRLGASVDQTTLWKVGVTGFGDAAFDGSHAEALAAPIPYTLVVAVAQDPAAREESDLSPGPQGSNDSFASADPLPTGGATTRGSLLPGDVDFFSIELEEGDFVTASVFDLGTAPLSVVGGERNDTLLGLFDPNGAPAVANDDGGPLFLSNLAFSVPPGGGGEWRVAVTTFEDVGFAGNHAELAFDYELVVASVAGCPNPVQAISQLTQPSIPPGQPPPPELMGDSYQLAHLGDGGRYYTDRFDPASHFVVDVPAELECAEWIVTRNDDKVVTDATGFLNFDVGEVAIVHVGFDNRATQFPMWLTDDYLPVPLVVDVKESGSQTGFEVWRRIVPAGPVSMGGNRAPPALGAGSNYVVFVTLPRADGIRELFGVAVGGATVSLELGGEVVVVATSPGDTAADLAAALAAEIEANANLAAQGIVALADGERVVTSGRIDDFASTDPGILEGPVPTVPASGGGGRVVLALLLVGASLGLRGLRGRRGASGSARPQRQAKTG